MPTILLLDDTYHAQPWKDFIEANGEHKVVLNKDIDKAVQDIGKGLYHLVIAEPSEFCSEGHVGNIRHALAEARKRKVPILISSIQTQETLENRDISEEDYNCYYDKTQGPTKKYQDLIAQFLPVMPQR